MQNFKLLQNTRFFMLFKKKKMFWAVWQIPVYLNFPVDQPWSDLRLDSSEMEIFHLPWNWTLCKQLYWQIILCQVKQRADKLYIFNLMPTWILTLQWTKLLQGINQMTDWRVCWWIFAAFNVTVKEWQKVALHRTYHYVLNKLHGKRVYYSGLQLIVLTLSFLHS